MTENQRDELYRNICRDIECGTYILAPNYVDSLIDKLKNCHNCKNYNKKKQVCFLHKMYSDEKKECLKNHKYWEMKYDRI